MDFDRAYALSIGISKYGSQGVLNLKQAAKDAADFAAFLTDREGGGYSKTNVVSRVNEAATKRNVIDAYSTLANSFSEESTFIFYFSGHGGVDENDQQYRLLLHGYDSGNQDTFLTEKEIIDLFESMTCGQVLFVLDCCRAGGMTRLKGKQITLLAGVTPKGVPSVLGEKLVKPASAGQGRVLIASCMPDELSWEVESLPNGLFTHCLIKGIRGECQSETHADIGVVDIFQYLLNNVKEVAIQYGVTQNCSVRTSVLTANFPICRASGSSKNRPFQTPGRFVHAVLDLEETREKLEEQFAHCLEKRELDSKFTYWGSYVTKKYIELMNSHEYTLAHDTADLLRKHSSEIAKHIRTGNAPVRVVSLGLGDGTKDAILLRELSNMRLEYWIIDISLEMLKVGIGGVLGALSQEQLRNIDLRPFQMDFMDIGLLKHLLTPDKQTVFLLLGNTLGNYPEDMLLNRIHQVANRGDWLLIDNQLKKPGRLSEDDEALLKRIYDHDKYTEYILAILARAYLEKEDGEIQTTITHGEAKNKLLTGNNSATVKQEFIVKKNKEVTIGGIKVSFSANAVLTVIYSRKYTKEALANLISTFFAIDRSFIVDDQYALMLTRRT